MKTDFKKTSKSLGETAARIQAINREVIMVLGAVQSPIGLVTFAAVLLVAGAWGAAFGFADLMYITRLQTAAAELGTADLKAKEVIEVAYQSAFRQGVPVMCLVGGAILLFDLFGYTRIAAWASFAEFLLGMSGFIYRGIDLEFTGIKFIAMILCGSAFIAASPFYMHKIGMILHQRYGKAISAATTKFTQLTIEDVESL